MIRQVISNIRLRSRVRKLKHLAKKASYSRYKQQDFHYCLRYGKSCVVKRRASYKNVLVNDPDIITIYLVKGAYRDKLQVTNLESIVSDPRYEVVSKTLSYRSISKDSKLYSDTVILLKLVSSIRSKKNLDHLLRTYYRLSTTRGLYDYMVNN